MSLRRMAVAGVTALVLSGCGSVRVPDTPAPASAMTGPARIERWRLFYEDPIEDCERPAIRAASPAPCRDTWQFAGSSFETAEACFAAARESRGKADEEFVCDTVRPVPVQDDADPRTPKREKP